MELARKAKMIWKIVKPRLSETATAKAKLNDCGAACECE